MYQTMQLVQGVAAVSFSWLSCMSRDSY